MRSNYSTILVAMLGFMIACSGPGSEIPADPDMRFGHRFEGLPPDGYGPITIQIPEEKSRFDYFPATFNHVIIRPDIVDDEQDTVAVEILVKGSLPNACMELHAFDQKRTGNIITATLQMRRPHAQICASVRRPYRLYLMLEGGFAPGHYTLKLNREVVPFMVRKFDTG